MASQELPIHGLTDQQDQWSVYTKTRSTINEKPLSKEELDKTNKYFNATLYMCLGMLYLKENPLLQEPLKKEHIKPRLLGHWGSDAGQSFTYIHMNRLIKKYDLDAFVISGPGHGAPGLITNFYLEGVYSETYPNKGEDIDGLQRFFKEFSFPGGVGSHMTPETPGSIHEGGELGYSISHAFGAVYDHPQTIALTIVGDGEAETGPLATSWHSNKFLNPITDGAVLPVLHLNGYKINNPTVLARVSEEELIALFKGYGWEPYFVEGSDIDTMHQAMAGTLEHCVKEIKKFQKEARDSGKVFRPRWPMIVLRSPKGWTAPKEVDGHKLEGFWRSHQVPLTKVLTDPEQLKLLESWMRSYEPENLFTKDGKFSPDLKELAPAKGKRMGENPITNGGLLLKPLKLQNFHDYGIKVEKPGVTEAPSMNVFAKFLRDIVRDNMQTFRVFGPDETESNKLAEIYKAGKKVWVNGYLPEDEDGGNLSPTGRVMEMLSEHVSMSSGCRTGSLLPNRAGVEMR